jgi:exportin-2 (importin alpha re-exporter)
MVTFTAEHSLAQVEVQRNFPLLVIKLIGDQTADPTIRFAAALFFKNYVKRHWVPVSTFSLDCLQRLWS